MLVWGRLTDECKWDFRPYAGLFVAEEEGSVGTEIYKYPTRGDDRREGGAEGNGEVGLASSASNEEGLEREAGVDRTDGKREEEGKGDRCSGAPDCSRSAKVGGGSYRVVDGREELRQRKASGGRWKPALPRATLTNVVLLEVATRRGGAEPREGRHMSSNRGSLSKSRNKLAARLEVTIPWTAVTKGNVASSIGETKSKTRAESGLHSCRLVRRSLSVMKSEMELTATAGEEIGGPLPDNPSRSSPPAMQLQQQREHDLLGQAIWDVSPDVGNEVDHYYSWAEFLGSRGPRGQLKLVVEALGAG
ncbi:unnamed protein product [Linum trigynum]|uniref:Uncharacterized protein n=1 Tax=Linum trigynum TaxID=586398 RepID=A0AAV2GAK1_9ROSI